MGAKPIRYTHWDSEVTGREVMPPVLQGYEMVGEIGRGSMGHVYEANSAEFGPVAVKVLNLFSEGSDMAVERFRREVSVGARIGHPGIPTVFDSGRLNDGRFYMVMELLRGHDLEDWWEAPGHTRAEALDLICAALEPLAAAHRHDVVHRDLKPENLFVENGGRVRLLDFGVARDADASQNVRTATGISVGTPVYMSPEQATKPTSVSSPADIWSVGVMIYEALSGELPFDGESPHAVILQACTREHTPLLERVPEVHPQVRALVDHCLRKDARDRPQDAGTLYSSLSALLRDEAVRDTLGGPAAAPSFRLSHSTAPTKLTQDIPPVAQESQVAQLEPAEPRAPRKLAAFAMAGLAVAVVAGVLVASMDEAPETSAEPTPQSAFTAPAFAAPPEPEEPVEAATQAEPPDPQPEIDDANEEAERQLDSASDARRARRRARRAQARVAEMAEAADLETTESALATAAPSMARATPEAQPSPDAVDPAETMTLAPIMRAEPTPTTRPVVATMRPRMRTRPRMRATPMETERPGFVTF